MHKGVGYMGNGKIFSKIGKIYWSGKGKYTRKKNICVT